jgi:hypothetical protein
MGARVWHVARAEYHKQAADFLSTDFPDWCGVALFYSALHYVHSSLADEPDLVRDERHPRKHTSPPTPGSGGRGVNQLVQAIYPVIAEAYLSLFDLSRRTRYDVKQLGGGNHVIPLAEMQWRAVRDHCTGLNQGRPTIHTSTP